MENVIIASFDPTVFGSRTLSDIKAHQTVTWKTITRDYPRLCTAHLATKMPIVLTTSANIRKYIKAGAYPKIDAIYYDPFTRYFHLPTTMKDYEKNKQKFEQIINREPTDPEIVKFFSRCRNIAKTNYTRSPTHKHQPLARAMPIDEEDEEYTSDEDTILPKTVHEQQKELDRTIRKPDNAKRPPTPQPSEDALDYPYHQRSTEWRTFWKSPEPKQSVTWDDSLFNGRLGMDNGQGTTLEDRLSQLSSLWNRPL